MAGNEGGSAVGDGSGIAGADIDDVDVNREPSTGSADHMIPRMSSSGTGGSFMLMGEGSSRVVQGGQSVWPSVVEVEGGREALLAECFRAMQRYQTRSARLQMRLDNLTKINAAHSAQHHGASTQGSTSHGSSEVLQAAVETEKEISVTSEERPERGKSPGTSRGASPMRARAPSVEGMQISGKTGRTGSAVARTEHDGVDLARKVKELTDELEAQKQRVFEASAQLRSYRVENRLMQRQNQNLATQLLEALGPANAAVVGGEAAQGGAAATATLDAAQCQKLRELLTNLKKLQGDDDDGALSGEDAIDEGDWRPYVTQAHPGTATSASGSSSPIQLARSS